MARSRNIKPGFFSNELLADLPAHDRLLFVGLWCLADRDGRLEDRPKRIKMELFPCDSYDVSVGLESLRDAGFVDRYKFEQFSVVEIVNFSKHQNPHGSEKDSILPDRDGYLTVNERRKNVVLIGKSKKVHVKEREFNVNPPLDNVDLPLDNALIPDSLIPDSLIPEYKTLVPSDDGTGDYSSEFEQFWKAYPKRDGGNSKKGAFKSWKARLRAGAKADDLILSASRYAEQMTAQGRIGTSFVKQASTFLGPDDHWQEVMTSNVHPIAIARNGNRPALKPGEWYHPDWDDKKPSTHTICTDETHDRATGYGWAWLKKQTWYKP